MLTSLIAPASFNGTQIQSEYGNYWVTNNVVAVDSRLVSRLKDLGFTLPVLQPDYATASNLAVMAAQSGQAVQQLADSTSLQIVNLNNQLQTAMTNMSNMSANLYQLMGEEAADDTTIQGLISQLAQKDTQIGTLLGQVAALQASLASMTPVLTGHTTSLSALNGLIAQVQASVPAIPTDIPAPESGTAAIGSTSKYAAEKHVHQRLSVVKTGTIGSNGLSGTILFDRSFTGKPGLMPVVDSSGVTQPTILEVASWVMPTANVYTGVVFKAYRLRLLPSTLALLSALINYDIAAGTANGTNFIVTAIQA